MSQPNSSRVRSVSIAALALAGVGVYLWIANEHYPVKHWLFFHYVRYSLYAALFSVSSLAAGLRVVAWLLPEPPRLGEKLTLAFALGVLVFALGVLIAGLAGLFGWGFFFGWPLLLLLAGGRKVWRDVLRAVVHLRPFGLRLLLPRSPVEALAAGLLVLGLVAVYLHVLTPSNVGADARAYHLPIAEHYAMRGAIRPFAEGWYLGAYPQLASLLYTWAFQSPVSEFDHIALSSHIEWALFLCTVAGVPTLTRRLLRGGRQLFAGAATFLFPGILLYDSNLNAGADHVLAFFAPAFGVALVRFARRFSVREGLLGGMLAAATVLTKYQAAMLVVPAGAFVLFLAVRTRRLGPAVAWATACLVISAGHWLKNLLFYGDPLYPMLHEIVSPHPFHAGAGEVFRYMPPETFALDGTVLHRVTETLEALVTFSFVPHDLVTFHGERPVFGSLFTLLLPVALFVRSPRRLWMLIAGVHVGVAVWFATFHLDRFLQALVPWMAACTAAMLMLAWRSGALVRASVAVLVALQIVWGGDVYFLPTHAMVRDSPLKALVDHLDAGHQGRYEERFRGLGALADLGRQLPRDAKVVVHDRHERFGLRTQFICDVLGWQGAIDYLLLETPTASARLWRELGATHVVFSHRGVTAPEILGREAVFARTTDQFCATTEDVAGWRLCRLGDTPKDPPLAAAPTRIAWLGCNSDPPLGIYSPKALAERKPERPLTMQELSEDPLNALAVANAAVVWPACSGLSATVEKLAAEFESRIIASDVAVWTRKPKP